MDRVTLQELKMNSREEVLNFLKKLWNEDSTNCPMCGTELELLHKKRKKVTVIGYAKLVIRFLRRFICWMN